MNDDEDNTMDDDDDDDITDAQFERILREFAYQYPSNQPYDEDIEYPSGIDDDYFNKRTSRINRRLRLRGFRCNRKKQGAQHRKMDRSRECKQRLTGPQTHQTQKRHGLKNATDSERRSSIKSVIKIGRNRNRDVISGTANLCTECFSQKSTSRCQECEWEIFDYNDYMRGYIQVDYDRYDEYGYDYGYDAYDYFNQICGCSYCS